MGVNKGIKLLYLSINTEIMVTCRRDDCLSNDNHLSSKFHCGGMPGHVIPPISHPTPSHPVPLSLRTDR